MTPKEEKQTETIEYDEHYYEDEDEQYQMFIESNCYEYFGWV